MAWRAVLGVVAAGALAVSVAGCGVTTTTSTGGSGTATPTGGGTTPTASQGTKVRPCPGPLEAVTIGSPALVLTQRDANKTQTARVGELVVVELPTTNRWSLDTQNSSLGTLNAQAQQGTQDSNTNTCLWIWQAHTAGTATIAFTGTALCESGVPCPTYAIAEKFTVTIS